MPNFCEDGRDNLVDLSMHNLENGYIVETRSFGELTERERADCLAMLKAGKAVNIDSAERELPCAAAVAILTLQQEIVGIGAIKRPRPGYARKIATRSGFQFNPYTNEIGYIAISPEHWGRKLSPCIVKFLLSLHDGPLFATTDNDRMKSTLTNMGFHQNGHEWDGKSSCLSLWTKGLS